MSEHLKATVDPIRDAGHDDVIGVLRAAARHPHKGPNDSDASMLREAAKRAAGGFPVGGSWTQATSAKVLRLVADLIEPTEGDPT
jgi:hypothetical protein